MRTLEQIRAERHALMDQAQAHLANQTPEEEREYLQRVTQYQRDALAAGTLPDVVFTTTIDPQTGAPESYPDPRLYGEG